MSLWSLIATDSGTVLWLNQSLICHRVFHTRLHSLYIWHQQFCTAYKFIYCASDELACIRVNAVSYMSLHCSWLCSVVCWLLLFCGDTESVWSRVVAGTQAAVLPAYRPSFQPIPPILSTANSEAVSTLTSKHFVHGSPSSSSSQLLSDDAGCEEDACQNTCDTRHLSVALDRDSTLHREESGVFLTPSTSSSVGPNLDPESSNMCSNSRSPFADPPVKSLANIGRKFRRFSDNGDVEYHRSENRGLENQASSPAHLETITDAAAEQAAADSLDAVNERRTSCQPVLYHRCDEEFVSPSSTKKKSKKSRRSSQPSSSCSTKSFLVYGGNPKWIWKS